MGLFDAGRRPGAQETVHERVLTAPNAITAVRLAGLPVVAWLVLGADAPLAAFWVLAAIAATDWVDGYVARRFDQVSRVGQVVDPLVDRLLLITAALTLLAAGLLPWPLVALLVGRDVVLLATSFALFGAVPPIPVNRAGKVATAALLTGLPGLLLGAGDWAGAEPVRLLAWALLVVGALAYYVAGVQYAVAAWRLRRGTGQPDVGPHG